MIKLVLFLKKIHVVLLFIVLEALAINYYANSTSYTKAKLVTASNHLTGGINSKISDAGDYFHLRRENERLTNELAALHNKFDIYGIVLEGRDSLTSAYDSLITVIGGERSWEYFSARVTNNSIMRQENYITVNKGDYDGIGPDMAVVSGDAIVGYVLNSSRNFSVCMSILNRDFRTGGRIKGGDYFGTVWWDGLSHEYVMLSEVPKYAELHRGDTIVTSGHSLRFPPGLMVGTVESFELNNATFYDIKVKLAADIPALNNVLVLKNMNYGEIYSLEESAAGGESAANSEN